MIPWYSLRHRTLLSKSTNSCDEFAAETFDRSLALAISLEKF